MKTRVRCILLLLVLPFGWCIALQSAYAQGGAPLWTNVYDGGSDDLPSHVAVDSNGKVFVTGGSWDGASSYEYVTVA